MTLFYARDIAAHFLVEIATVEEWFRRGVIAEADSAAAICGHWVTTADNIIRAMDIDPTNLDQAERERLAAEPVVPAELAWLLSSRAKRVSEATARSRMRRPPNDPRRPGFLHFKLPGSKLLYAHRFDVERKLNRDTSREAFLREFPEQRKPREKYGKPGS